MWKSPFGWIFTFFTIFACINGQTVNSISEDDMQSLLNDYNLKATELCHEVQLANWDVATDVGNPTKVDAKKEAVLKNAEFQKKWWDDYWKNANIDNYKNEQTRRQLFFLKQLGNAALEQDRLSFLTGIITKMSAIYNSATVCPFEDQNCADDSKNRLALDPDITERFATSRNFDELKYLWEQWRNESGRLMKSDYSDYVVLMNEVATKNEYANAADYWQSEFEEPQFEQIVDDLWLTVKPLYDELHKYMRYKLISIYGDKIDHNDENIPAHLLGNMWAQSWQNLYADTKPFNVGTAFDTTAKMIDLNFDAMKMFETSNSFYMSLGLPTNEMSYTGQSLILKPTNRTIQCHASAWDFCDGKDFRIKMCTNVNEEDLITIHHEMGQYVKLIKK